LWFYTAILQVAKTVNIVKAKGGKVTREPGVVKGGSVVTASVEDPSGYRFEQRRENLHVNPYPK
jgi:lactoylglutathione lyase